MHRQRRDLEVERQNGHTANRRRKEYAKEALEELCLQAMENGQTGTIGVEIPVKDGRLGKVKRVNITFQPD